MKKWLIAVVCVFGIYSQAKAYDKKYIEQHIRKALNLDTRTQIDVSTAAVPSEFGTLLLVPVTINGGPFQIYLSKDEKAYIWGYPIDLTTDPDKTRAGIINLKNVHSRGSLTAPVTIVEYSDLQCSFCKRAHEILNDELFKAYDEKTIRLVFKHFPLRGHDWAEEAAVAAECAGEQGEKYFWSATDFFFSNSVNISTSNIKSKTIEYGKTAQFDSKKYNQCLSSNRALGRVQADRKEGFAAGVNSTPSLFINGRLVRGFRSFDDIRVVVDEKLKEASQKK